MINGVFQLRDGDKVLYETTLKLAETKGGNPRFDCSGEVTPYGKVYVNAEALKSVVKGKAKAKK